VLSVFGFLSKDMLLMFSSALGGAFFVFSALLFYLILKKIFNRIDVPLIIITFFLFSPFSILISLNALETPFFIFFLMLIFWFYISFIRKKNFSLVRILILNILLFILILTREEGYLVFFSFIF